MWLAILPFLIYALYRAQRQPLHLHSFLSRVITYILVAPGTALHELAHALMCVFLRVRVRRFVPFYPRKQADGSYILGYVLHDQAGPVASPLIAAAPLFLVPPLTALISHFLIHAWLPAEILDHLQTASAWQIGLWLYLVFSASQAAFPSPGDHIGALGLVILSLLGVLALFVIFQLGNAESILALPKLLDQVLFLPALFGMLRIYWLRH